MILELEMKSIAVTVGQLNVYKEPDGRYYIFAGNLDDAIKQTMFHDVKRGELLAIVFTEFHMKHYLLMFGFILQCHFSAKGILLLSTYLDMFTDHNMERK